MLLTEEFAENEKVKLPLVIKNMQQVYLSCA